jgi:hypothetical protein
MRHTLRLGAAAALAFGITAEAPRVLYAQERPFIGVRVDADRNKVLLEVTPDRIGKDFLHQTVLATGGGVGALGLDRGQTRGAPSSASSDAASGSSSCATTGACAR